MNMGTGRAACAAGPAHDLAPSETLAEFSRDWGEVAVARWDVIAVVYNDNITIAAMCAGIDDQAVGSWADGRAEEGGYIETSMILVALAKGVASTAEAIG